MGNASLKEYILKDVIPTLTNIQVRDDIVRYLEADLPITNALIGMLLLYSDNVEIKNKLSKLYRTH